ncbi:MAG: hypothetical protein U0230_05520 [Polyangiales bacterium]
MTNTWKKAGGLLLGCIVAIGSAACDDGGKTTSDAGSGQDSGAQDSGSQDSGSQDSGSQDAAQDAAAPQAAIVRLGHLAYGVGTPTAGTAGPPTIPATWKAHVCVLTQAGATTVANTLFTARDVGTGGTHSYQAAALQYGAISAYNTAPLVALNSTASLTRTAQIWNQDDIDETMFGTGVAANCVPKASRTPVATLQIPVGGTAGAFQDMKKYTILVTGRDAAATTNTECYDLGDNVLAAPTRACPSVSIQVLSDDHAAPATGTAWRIVNTSTTYGAQTSCHATITAADLANGGATTGISALIPIPTMTAPLPVFRVGSTGLPANSAVLSSGYSDLANIVSTGYLTGSGVPANTPDTYFSPSLGSGACPAKILFSGTPTATDMPANGTIPQQAAIQAGYSGGVAATAVGNTGTANGNIATVFIMDAPPQVLDPATAPLNPPPAAILIRDNP